MRHLEELLRREARQLPLSPPPGLRERVFAALGSRVVRRPPSRARWIRRAAADLTLLIPPAEDETCTSRIALLAEQLEQMVP